MPESLRVPAASPMDEASSLRPFRAAYWFGGFNGLTWMTVSEPRWCSLPRSWEPPPSRWGPAPGIVVSRFALFFALGIAVNALLVALFARLPDHRAWK